MPKSRTTQIDINSAVLAAQNEPQHISDIIDTIEIQTDIRCVRICNL